MNEYTMMLLLILAVASAAIVCMSIIFQVILPCVEGKLSRKLCRDDGDESYGKYGR